MNDPNKHISSAKRSGFPLQIAVTHVVENSSKWHGWSVLHTEHAWKTPPSGGDDFLDVVLENEHRTSVLNIECKRVQNSNWTFLVPKASPNKRFHVNSWVSLHEESKLRFFNWFDLVAEPSSHQSAYCVVEGQDPKARPMLERTAAEVVESTEALAKEKADSGILADRRLRIYYNVIVTTATLNVVNFDPKDITLENGEIKQAAHQEVPFVRFRKQLTTHACEGTFPEIKSREGFRVNNEKTAFVINSMNLVEFLREFKASNGSVNRVREYAR